MKNDMEVKLGSTIVGRINSAHLSQAERQVALNAMRDADLLVDGIMWVAKKIEQIGERLFLKPSTKSALKPSLKH